MTFSVTMPALGESVSEGTVTRWLKAEGDHVNVDEPLLEVSTDKVDTEIPSPVSGTLQKIVVQIDQTVPVGAELAIIADGAAASAPAPAAAPAAPVVETPAPVAAAPVTPPPVPAAPAAPATSAPTGSGTVITMPALGESVSEGTVTRWLKNVGDAVAVDEALLEVSTDKVDTEIPSPVAGTLLAIDVAVDTTVPVGARLGLIGAAGGAVSAPATPAPVTPVVAPVAAAPVTPPPAPVVAAPVVSAPVTPPPAPVVSAPVISTPVAQVPAQPVTTSAVSQTVSQPADAYVTPLVRKLASELGVNLAQVKGTGIGGRIRREDVEALARPAAPAASVAVASTPSSAKPPVVAVSPLRGTTVTMSRLRKVIAARMVESLQVSAQLTTVVEVDVTKISRLRDRAKASFEAREGVKLSFLPFFAVAVCER
jgi:pyruvate dehydrogenase E2 component (dihydrolipoamide acetyltransferase)